MFNLTLFLQVAQFQIYSTTVAMLLESSVFLFAIVSSKTPGLSVITWQCAVVCSASSAIPLCKAGQVSRPYWCTLVLSCQTAYRWKKETFGVAKQSRIQGFQDIHCVEGLDI